MRFINEGSNVPLFETSKVDVPDLVAYLDWTSIYEWYVAWCGSKNGYQSASV
jgi:hypothetical protein